MTLRRTISSSHSSESRSTDGRAVDIWVLNLRGMPARSDLEKAALGRAAMRIVIARNLAFLRQNPTIPDIAEAGVRFQREPWAGTGVEEVAGVPVVLQRGWADCDDAVAYRCALLQSRGIDAQPMVRWKNGKRYFHGQVRLPNGEVSDPSADIGMR